MEAAYIVGIGIVLYLLADRILDTVERRVGRRLEHRTGVFFLILLVLALGSFWLIRAVVDG